jgi:hypothetical protein
MERVIEIGFRTEPKGELGDWFVRIATGKRPADYVDFRTQLEARTYACELENEFGLEFAE